MERALRIVDHLRALIRPEGAISRGIAHHGGDEPRREHSFGAGFGGRLSRSDRVGPVGMEGADGRGCRGRCPRPRRDDRVARRSRYTLRLACRNSTLILVADRGAKIGSRPFYERLMASAMITPPRRRSPGMALNRMSVVASSHSPLRRLIR